MKKNNFYDKVYIVARHIPFGRVTSYGAIATYLGAKRSARMVGWAMNNSHTQDLAVPAHRVVNRLGILTGKHHFDGVNIMQLLGTHSFHNQLILKLFSFYKEADNKIYD